MCCTPAHLFSVMSTQVQSANRSQVQWETRGSNIFMTRFPLDTLDLLFPFSLFITPSTSLETLLPSLPEIPAIICIWGLGFSPYFHLWTHNNNNILLCHCLFSQSVVLLPPSSETLSLHACIFRSLYPLSNQSDSSGSSVAAWLHRYQRNQREQKSINWVFP